MSTTTSGSKKKVIVLRSNDNETFEVEEAVAMVSQTIKNMIEDVSGDDLIPLPNVDAKTLSRVIEYCTNHSRSTTPTDDNDDDGDGDARADLSEFDSEFLKGAADWDVLFDLILAANYLNIKGLLDLTCQAAADRLKDETCMDKVRAIFNIDNDYTPEEEKELRETNSWAFIV